MPGPGNPRSPIAQKFWSIVYAQSATPPPEVVIHDPAAQRAHNLDDPFFDNKVQSRIAGMIAGAKRKKKKQ